MGLLIVNDSGETRAIAAKNISDVSYAETPIRDEAGEQIIRQETIIVVDYEPTTRSSRTPQRVTIQDTYDTADTAKEKAVKKVFTDILDLMTGKKDIVNVSDFTYPSTKRAQAATSTVRAQAKKEAEDKPPDEKKEGE